MLLTQSWDQLTDMININNYYHSICFYLDNTDYVVFDPGSRNPWGYLLVHHLPKAL
jgi:hypothetical protein